MTQPDDNLPKDVLPDDGTEPAPSPESRPRLYWRLLRLPLFFAVLFAGGFLGLYFQPPGLQAVFERTGLQPGGGADDPFALPRTVEIPDEVVASLEPSDVVGLARLLPRGEVATVARPFGAGDARIDELLAAIGDDVSRGDRVAVLDNLASLEIAVAQAEANVALQEASLLQTQQSVAISIAEAEATLDQALAAEEVAQTEFERTQSLLGRGVTTQAQFDQAQLELRQAEQSVASARATLSRFTSDDPEEQADVIVARRTLDAAKADVEQARRDLQKAYVVSPIDGTILDIHSRPGEVPGSDGVMEVGRTAEMMAEVEVYQNQVRQIEIGQPVDLLAEPLGETLTGTVEHIGLIVGRQDVVSDDTAANVDARVVDVLVALDQESSEIASRFTGLEVVARIDTGGTEAAARSGQAGE
ncbi:HlyD family efflux transporter periplasmic adaptor subunit [Aestuariibius sp. 2305UL40-4]|uniref:HlyD family efflux transporter periplasmic adaptor subunit n=1 Tax=Aestuariibius violaceus TaxID=3234132 RepID=UPI00345E6B80